jgi:hypothetical protein
MDKVIRVKITKCKLDTYWYADKVGREFEVVRFSDAYRILASEIDWKSKEQVMKNDLSIPHPDYYIQKGDAEVIETE